MERLSEEQLQALLPTPWLVKNDASRSVFLMKFAVHRDSVRNQNIALLIATDTNKCWYEVLPFNRILNRWLQANPALLSFDAPAVLNKLEAAHTSSGFGDAEFTLEETDEYDLSFVFNFDLEWFWRWNLVLLGPHRSSDLLSSQLILPMILTNHHAIQTVCAQPSYNKQNWIKGVDATGHHAKRAMIHQVKGAAAKPLFSETLQRMTSAMHGITLSDKSAPLRNPETPIKPNSTLSSGQPRSSRSEVSTKVESFKTGDNAPMEVDLQVSSNDKQPTASSSKPPVPNQIDENGEESVTEPDDDEPILPATRTERKPDNNSNSESESEPPSKKKRMAPKQEPLSSTDDSDEEPKRPKPASAATRKQAPVRQPVKRGGKKW